MNEQLLVIFAAIIPAIVLVCYIYVKDERPEPFSQMLKAFVLGALAAPLSTLVSEPLGYLGYYDTQVNNIIDSLRISFFGAGIPEELAKLFVLWLAVRRNKAFDEYFDGIVYAVCVGMGFAALENVEYLFRYYDEWRQIGVTRALMAVPGHFLFATLMGYYYALAHFKQANKSHNYVMAFVAPMVAHGMYDTFAFMEDGTLGSALFLIAIVVLLYKLYKHFKQNMKRLQEEDYYKFEVVPPALNDDKPMGTPPPLPGSKAAEDEDKEDERRFMPEEMRNDNDE